MDHRAKAEEIYRAIQDHFSIPGTGLYRQNYPGQLGDRKFVDCWGYGSLLSATVALGLLDREKYHGALRTCLSTLERYWQGPGYSSYVMDQGGGDRYYDDNEWLGLEYLSAYRLLHEPRLLDRARGVWDFVISGWSTDLGGGIYWRERDTSTKNTCSNGPAIVFALGLFQATGESRYLDWAKRIYGWLNARLRSPTNVYWDSFSSAGHVDGTTWTYNTGIMVHANVLLYQATRSEQYLDQARLVAHSSLDHFAGRRLDGVRMFPDSPWFNAVMFRGYLALADATGDSTYCDALVTCLDYGWDHAHAGNGLLGPDWSGRFEMDKGYWPLLDQAAVVEMYALAARREATAAALAGGAGAPPTGAAAVLSSLAPVAEAGGLGGAGMGAGTQAGLQPLTLRLGVELVSPMGTVGSCRRSGYGLVCDAQRTGPVPIAPAIADYYARQGGPSGRLGFPLTAPVLVKGAIAGTQGLLQHFEGSLEYPPDVLLAVNGVECGATIYWTVPYGAHITWFEIGAAYELAGGPSGRLGFPTGERVPLGPSQRGTSGYWQPMEDGAIYWSRDRGTFAVGGPVHNCHDRLAGATGILGFPVTAELPAIPSPSGATGVFQRFEGQHEYPAETLRVVGNLPCGATVYWSALGGAHATWGAIGAHYESDSGSGGKFGFPLGDVETLQDGRLMQQFERGHIFWSPEKGAYGEFVY